MKLSGVVFLQINWYTYTQEVIIEIRYNVLFAFIKKKKNWYIYKLELKYKCKVLTFVSKIVGNLLI